jgi:hypothetical protein
VARLAAGQRRKLDVGDPPVDQREEVDVARPLVEGVAALA